MFVFFLGMPSLCYSCAIQFACSLARMSYMVLGLSGLNEWSEFLLAERLNYRLNLVWYCLFEVNRNIPFA